MQRTRIGPGANFGVENLKDPAALAAQLVSPTDRLSQALRAALPPKARHQLCPAAGAELEPGVPAALVRGLNKLDKGPGLYDPVGFPESRLSPETRRFRAQHPQPKGKLLAQFNRLLLRDAYPQQISTAPVTEFAWLVTSRAPAQLGPESFLRANRQYWGIENGAHQRLDCSALEDRLRVRDPNVVAVLGLLHRMSLSLFLAWAQQQPNPRDRTYPTWQDRQAANRWIMIQQVLKAPA